MKRNVDGRLSSYEKFQIWFGQYAFIFFSISFVVLLLLALLTFYVYYGTQKEKEYLFRTIEKLSNYGIFVTQDNRIVALEKTPIGNALVQGAVKEALIDDFILSRFSFYGKDGSFIRANPEKPKEFLSMLIKESDDVAQLWNYFVKDDRESIKTFYLYVKYLYELARDGKLPDIIQPVTGTKVEYFVKVGKSGFRAKVDVPVVVSYYTASGELKGGSGVISFTVEGVVNPIKTASYYQKNPFGIIVRKLTVSYVTVDKLEKK